MKKAISTLAIAAMAITHVMSQTIEQKPHTAASSKYYYGIKAGVNHSTLKETGSSTIAYKSLTGLTAGVYVGYHFNPTFALQTEMLYNVNGARYFAAAKTVLGYLSVPVLAKYTIANSGFGIFAGPQFSFLLNAKDTWLVTTDIKSSMKGTDFSGIIGVDYTCKRGFNLGVRYQLGLSNIAINDPLDPSFTQKNRAFSITLGYTINKH